jgi:hypothetical protein
LPIRYGKPSASRRRHARRLHPPSGKPSRGRAAAGLCLLLAATIALAGCAAPSAPRPPSELVPEAVTDLRARQTGDAVVLHFTLPRKATDGKSLAGSPRIEIYREFHPAGAPAAAAEETEPQAGTAVSAAPTYTLSAQQLAGDLAGDTVTWADAFPSSEFQAHRGQTVSYRVRTAAGGSDWSAPSKAAKVALVLPPAPVREFTATASGAAVELRWQAPEPGTSPTPETFLLYRTALGPEGGATAPVAAGATTGTTYRDTSVEPDRSYRYTVRGMARVNGEEVESADSEAVVVHVPAAAPPAEPEGLTAIPVRAPGHSPEVDLSWEIGSEANLAGYNVYRSEQPGRRGERLNRQVLAAPAFRDTTVTPGRSYSYSVTAVGPTGIESKASAPVTVSVPKVASSPQ